MRSKLPDIDCNRTKHNLTTLKKNNKYKAIYVKNPYQKTQIFSIRAGDKPDEYNPLRDRYLQQFFRRQQRIKQLSLFSNQASSEVKQTIQKIIHSSKNKLKSSYQNLICSSNHNSTRNKIVISKDKSRYDGQGKCRVGTQGAQKWGSVSRQDFCDFLEKARSRIRLNMSMSNISKD